VNGIEHAWNLPSEEVYTVPDPGRADGRVRLTRPAVVTGRLVAGVSLTFADGRLIEITGGEGVDALRESIARDSGMSRLGELALVDDDSAVAGTGQTFGMILLDENTAAHIALGFGFPELVDPAERDRVTRARITWTFRSVPSRSASSDMAVRAASTRSCTPGNGSSDRLNPHCTKNTGF
jgi:aminopeptidase